MSFADEVLHPVFSNGAAKFSGSRWETDQMYSKFYHKIGSGGAGSTSDHIAMLGWHGKMCRIHRWEGGIELIYINILCQCVSKEM